MSNAGSCHDHGNCELCDHLEREQAEDRRTIATLLKRLEEQAEALARAQEEKG